MYDFLCFGKRALRVPGNKLLNLFELKIQATELFFSLNLKMFEKSIVKEVCETDSQIWAVPVFIYSRSGYKQSRNI